MSDTPTPDGPTDDARGREQRPRRDDRAAGSRERRGGHQGAPRRGDDAGSQDRRRHTDRRTDGRTGGERGGHDRGESRSGGGDRRTFGPRQGPSAGRPDRGGRPQGDHRRRGGDGASGPRAGQGRGADSRPARAPEPDLPDDALAKDLEGAVRRDLLSLDKSNAETVARHLVMTSRLIADDPAAALAHARAARGRAGRIAVVRETAGIAAYHAGEWAEALSELRAARRMAGGPGLLSVMADCERGLGRPERAIELGRSDEARMLTGDDAAELRIVVAGARMDMGQYDQAVVTLQTADLDGDRDGSAAARYYYAYADALVAAGRAEDGLQWFLRAAAADIDGETDAEDRVDELTGP
ncbi:hypothetical protein [Rhodococcoides kroppenstedtii]|uniref:hypothetical protein n=1 Tax=Rhodococcoides kroppenstedtii TaxID=293050 RepID=UPI0030B90C8E